MPGVKGNKNAKRADAPVRSSKSVEVVLTPGEHEKWKELAHGLKVSMNAMIRDAVREKRERMIAAGLKLKR
jgi:hypothetical protein